MAGRNRLKGVCPVCGRVVLARRLPDEYVIRQHKAPGQRGKELCRGSGVEVTESSIRRPPESSAPAAALTGSEASP